MSGVMYKPSLKRNRIVDLYVDDNFTACLDKIFDKIHETRWVFRSFGNSFDVVFAPEITIEGASIERKPALSIRKLLVEGIPQEEQKVLGWMIDTWTMTVSLPEEKVQGWVAEIQGLTRER